MSFKFEKLEVWELATQYSDHIYDLADKLPRREEGTLRMQIIRAPTSIALNIAEGSTTQSNAEQARFLGMAIRSLIETVACLDLIQRRNYCGSLLIDQTREQAEKLFAKLQAFRNSLR